VNNETCSHFQVVLVVSMIGLLTLAPWGTGCAAPKMDLYFAASCGLPRLDAINDYLQEWNQSWPPGFEVIPWEGIKVPTGFTGGVRMWFSEATAAGVEGDLIQASRHARVTGGYYASDRLDASLGMKLSVVGVLGTLWFRLRGDLPVTVSTSIGAGYYAFNASLSSECRYIDNTGVSTASTGTVGFSGGAFGLKLGVGIEVRLRKGMSLIVRSGYRLTGAAQLSDNDGITLTEYTNHESGGMDISGVCLAAGIVSVF